MSTMCPQTDKFNVLCCLFVLGLSTLLPWNFFNTATGYFYQKLTDAAYVAIFSTMSAICATMAMLLTAVSSFATQKPCIKTGCKIIIGLSGLFVAFAVTASLVRVEVQPLGFLILTLISVIIINVFCAVLQLALFNLVSLMDAACNTAYLSGQGLAGIFSASTLVCLLATGASVELSAEIYFSIACLVSLAGIFMYGAIVKSDYYKTVPQCDNPVTFASLRNIWSYVCTPAVMLFTTLLINTCVFPSVMVDVKPPTEWSETWKILFSPLLCFLVFFIGDWLGRTLGRFWHEILVERALVIFTLSRTGMIFVFMFCNVQPRYLLPVLFANPAWFCVFNFLFALTGGYLVARFMRMGPDRVLKEYKETAGAAMTLALFAGLAAGALCSFGLRAMI